MMDEKLLYRIIDANLNRTKEALRVCEEIVRFGCNDAGLTHTIRELRHKISEILLDMPVRYIEIINSRDAESDVARQSSLESKSITGFLDIFLANMSRAKEGLRALEEFSRLLDTRCAQSFKSLRFSVYECEKKAVKVISSLCHY